MRYDDLVARLDAIAVDLDAVGLDVTWTITGDPDGPLSVDVAIVVRTPPPPAT